MELSHYVVKVINNKNHHVHIYDVSVGKYGNWDSHSKVLEGFYIEHPEYAGNDSWDISVRKSNI